MIYPSAYIKEKYIEWHHDAFPDDYPLIEKIDSYRENLKNDCIEELELLGDLLYYVIPICKKEYKIHNMAEFDFTIPLKDALKQKDGVYYDLLFKSTDSIINKLWRKNKISPEINLSNLSNPITDLIRTEVVCSTLSACKFVAQRLILNNINLPEDYPLKNKLFSLVDSIEFEPEMKMASGYFAYHGLLKFKSGVTIELQIYSSLTNTWRKLSHKLYEKARLNLLGQIDFATSEARLISLGHLLHLAECEVQRLEKEIN